MRTVYGKPTGNSSIMLFYSVLLLAAAKPACDYIVKIVAKNTDEKIDQVTTVMQTTRVDMLNEIERLVLMLNEGNMSRDEVLGGLADLLNKQVSRTNELSRDIADIKKYKKQMSPSKSKTTDGRLCMSAFGPSGELQKIHEQTQSLCLSVAEVKKLVLEDRTNFHEPTRSSVEQIIGDCKSGFAGVNDMMVENRTLAHNDALSLHAEHVQMYKM